MLNQNNVKQNIHRVNKNEFDDKCIWMKNNQRDGNGKINNTTSKVKLWLNDTPKMKVNQLSQKNEHEALDLNVINIAKATAEHIAVRKSIPRKLPTFSGSPKDWPMFFSAYETSTNELQMSNAQNLMRLRESLKGEALALVEEDLQFPDSVPEVMKTLRQLYGRADNINFSNNG